MSGDMINDGNDASRALVAAMRALTAALEANDPARSWLPETVQAMRTDMHETMKINRQLVGVLGDVRDELHALRTELTHLRLERERSARYEALQTATR